MPIYVDNAQHKFGRMIMCHMIADTPQELAEMVDKIGVLRRWFQLGINPHFDISKGKRELAISHGAIPCTTREAVGYLKILRNDKCWRDTPNVKKIFGI